MARHAAGRVRGLGKVLAGVVDTPRGVYPYPGVLRAFVKRPGNRRTGGEAGIGSTVLNPPPRTAAGAILFDLVERPGQGLLTELNNIPPARMPAEAF